MAGVVTYPVVALGILFLLVSNSSSWSRTLTAADLKRLFGNDEIGTTLTFQGRADRIFYAGTWANSLRRSKALGPTFIRDKIRSDTLAEGAFLGAIGPDRSKLRGGIAGIIADKDTGNGIVIFIETFAGDTSLRAFQSRKRRYMLLLVSEDDSGLTCKSSNWNQLGGAANNLRFATDRCEFVIGNSVTK